MAQIVLMMLGGVGLFDSICHTFTTLATGGFSTMNESIAGFHSAYVETVIIVFKEIGDVAKLLSY